MPNTAGHIRQGLSSSTELRRMKYFAYYRTVIAHPTGRYDRSLACLCYFCLAFSKRTGCAISGRFRASESSVSHPAPSLNSVFPGDTLRGKSSKSRVDSGLLHSTRRWSRKASRLWTRPRRDRGRLSRLHSCVWLPSECGNTAPIIFRETCPARAITVESEA